MSQLDEQDVLAALEKLGDRKRDEFEAALPELGALVALVEVEKVARLNRSTAIKSQRLVRWQCTENPAHTLSGFPSQGSSLERRCQGIPATKKTDWNPADGKPICGARMKVIHDDYDYAESPTVKWEWPERSGAR